MTDEWFETSKQLPRDYAGDVIVFTSIRRMRFEPARFVCELHDALEEGESPAFTHWRFAPQEPK